jgi:serine/threonine-protein kinase
MEIRAGVNLGRYQLLAEIGRGAAGTVYQALDPDIDRLVAIKIFSALDPNSAETQSFRELFAQEARAAGRLMHPGIVAIYDRGEEPETQTPYIVMEYVAGQPLSKLLSTSSARIEERFALQVAKEIAEALAYAHEKGVVHRDVKPSNILLTEEGNAKITDFGIARLDSSSPQIQGDILGTPAYMSPEQLMGGPLDGRTDIFSLGVILYTMLSGFRPFQGNGASTICFKVVNQEPVSITNLHLDLSKDSDYVVARAMAKDPEQRYATGTEMAQDVGDILDGRTPRSRNDAAGNVSADVIRVDRDYRPFLKGVGQSVSRATLAASFESASKTPSEARTPTSATSSSALLSQSVPPSAQSTRQAYSPVWVLAAIIGFASITGVWAEHMQRAALRSTDATMGMPPVLRAKIDVPQLSPLGSEADEPEVIVRVHKPLARAFKAQVPDLDYIMTPGPETPPREYTTVAAVAPLSPPVPSFVPPPPAIKPATLQLELQHHLADAELSVWIDDQLAYSGKSHGEARKRMFLLRGATAGKETHDIQIPSGRHEVKVRVHSKDGQYDESAAIHNNFLESQHSSLEIRCNRRGIELKMTGGS